MKGAALCAATTSAVVGFGIGTRRFQLQVAAVVAVHVGQQHHVDRAQPRIVAARHVVCGIVEKTHAGRVLENDRAIVRTQFPGLGTDRLDPDVLGQGRKRGKRQDDCGTGAAGNWARP